MSVVGIAVNTGLKETRERIAEAKAEAEGAEDGAKKKGAGGKKKKK